MSLDEVMLRSYRGEGIAGRSHDAFIAAEVEDWVGASLSEAIAIAMAMSLASGWVPVTVYRSSNLTTEPHKGQADR
jgi:hypothetical protein